MYVVERDGRRIAAAYARATSLQVLTEGGIFVPRLQGALDKDPLEIDRNVHVGKMM